MPAARLTRWRSGRSSFRASADLRAHRASAIKVAVPGETGRGARQYCPADLQLPRTTELRRRGGCAHLLRRSRARGSLSWCSTVGCPCEAAGGPAGGIERLLAAPSTSCVLRRDEQPEPGATNGDAEMRGTCSAVFYAINGRAALHGAMDMAG